MFLDFKNLFFSSENGCLKKGTNGKNCQPCHSLINWLSLLNWIKTFITTCKINKKLHLAISWCIKNSHFIYMSFICTLNTQWTSMCKNYELMKIEFHTIFIFNCEMQSFVMNINWNWYRIAWLYQWVSHNFIIQEAFQNLLMR